jgi:hypothetical protein
MKKLEGLRPLAEIVGEADSVLDRLARAGSELERLQRVWPFALGAELAAHCRPALLDGARVIVHADAAVWASRLRHLQTTTLVRLADAGFGQIKEMRIVVRPAEGKG